MLAELVAVIDSRGRTLTPCRRKVAEREVRLNRAKWLGPNRIRLRFDPFAYRYIRLKVLERDQYVCYWCRRPGDTMDHIIPWSKGGRTTMDNCVCACQECNGQRGDMPAEKFAQLRNVSAPQFAGGVLMARQELAAGLEDAAQPELVVLSAPSAQLQAAVLAERLPAAAPALGESPYTSAMVALLDPYGPVMSRRHLY